VRSILTAMVCAVFGLGAAPAAQAPQQSWANFARIAAYSLGADNTTSIAQSAARDHVFGIEVDNDIPGRYESFLDPTQKLKDIRSMADAAHRAGNHAFVYIAGTECITAHADHATHSVVKDHPDWLQRKITGEPATFTGGAAFWIREGDEDVWITPYAKDWRKVYMERVRQIAGTGIDGIYVDIPYWMTHFDGWENTWASFDDHTVAAFREKTGLDARKDLKLGDFKDSNFRKWVDFRIETMTDFLNDIRENARSVNPKILLIPEIYPGIEQEATRVGADVYQIYGVSDVIAHEYEFGEGDHMASSRSQLDWFLYQAGMLSFRAFAQGKPTWILNYSWDGDKNVDAREAMKNLAMSQVIAGANFWDAPGHSMAGSNDEATRTAIFKWIEKNERSIYLPRAPLHPVGVYFSPKSRDYSPDEFLPSYRGLLVMLLQAHQEFQVVTPRNLSQFHGETLVLPNVSVLSEEEKSFLQKFVANQGKIVITGRDETGLSQSEKILRFENCPATEFLAGLRADFAKGSQRQPTKLLQALQVRHDLEVDAPSTVASNFGEVDGKPQIFLANFGGLVPGKIAVPEPAHGIKVRVSAAKGSSLAYLPFLGETQTLEGVRRGEQLEFVLPDLERGAIVTVNPPNGNSK
jgi:endo-alpha-1,4-polygalactosaminidase (GH114 family)